jgi:two-component system nitrate/nitrite response regulator NarL
VAVSVVPRSIATGVTRKRSGVMRVLILAEVGLYREALAGSLGRDPRFEVVGVAAALEQALAGVEDHWPDIVLVDMPATASAGAVRTLSRAAPRVKVIALGVPEVGGDVIALAEAGASGYVGRDGSTEDLAATIESVARGEMLCSPEVAGTLFRRLGALAERRVEVLVGRLTARELDVLRLIEEGLSNKEIARALSIELPTVKNHVHSILEKLNVRRRTEAAARARRYGLLDLVLPGA